MTPWRALYELRALLRLVAAGFRQLWPDERHRYVKFCNAPEKLKHAIRIWKGADSNREGAFQFVLDKSGSAFPNSVSSYSDS